MGARNIQRFALNSDGWLIDVRSLSDRGGLFFCPNCHDRMIPKDCSICFWLGGSPGERICKLYKRCGNPMWCDENDAPNCRMFRANKQLIEDCLEMCRDWGVHEIWRRDSVDELFGETHP